MGVNNNDIANETTFNDAFMARGNDTDTTGKVDLKNGGSATILDAQKTINDNKTEFDDHADDDNAHREVDTKSNLVTWAATADNGSQAFATDEKAAYQVIDGVLESIGGGGGLGTPNIYGVVTPTDYDLSTWDDSNLVTATLGLNTTTPLFSDSSYELTNAVGASGYVNGPSIAVDSGHRQKYNSNEWTYKYDGTDDALRFDFYNITDDAIIGSELIKNTDAPTPIIPQGWLPETCENVRVVITVLTAEAATLIFDQGVYSDKPAQEINVISQGSAGYYALAGGGTLTSRSDGSGGIFYGGFPYTGDISEFFTVTTNAGGYVFTAKKKVTFNSGFASLSLAGTTYTDFYVNGSQTSTNTSGTVGSGVWTWANISTTFEKDDYFELHQNTTGSTAGYFQFYINCISESPAVVHTGVVGVESVLLDGHAGFGSTNTVIPYFTNERINTSSEIIEVTNSATLGTIITAKQPCTVVVSYAYNPTSTGTNFGITKNASLTTGIVSLAADKVVSAVTSTSGGARTPVGVPVTLGVGEYIAPHFNTAAGTSSPANVWFSAVATASARNIITPLTQTCYIKDVKAAGVDGGTATSGSWATRDLNVVNMDSSLDNDGCPWVSLNSNVFTLPKGSYYFDTTAPGYRVNNYRIKLVSDPLGTPADVIFSKTANAANGTPVATEAILRGTVIVTESTSFEIQQRVQTTFSSAGLGLGFDLGVSEEYTQVVITKLK